MNLILGIRVVYLIGKKKNNMTPTRVVPLVYNKSYSCADIESIT
jgi:hypothetical protein